MKQLILTLLWLVSTPAWSQWSKISSTDFPLASPPKVGSAAYRKDYEILFQAQTIRTERDCYISSQQKHASFQHLFAYSTLISAEEYQKVAPLFDRVFRFSGRVAGYHKKKFTRVRPYVASAQIKPCVDTSGLGENLSYPSSHAALASVGSCLLSTLFPERRNKLQSYGNYIANLRVKVGVHHPSDVMAGKRLGLDICKRLLREPDFRHSLGNLLK